MQTRDSSNILQNLESSSTMLNILEPAPHGAAFRDEGLSY